MFWSSFLELRLLCDLSDPVCFWESAARFFSWKIMALSSLLCYLITMVVTVSRARQQEDKWCTKNPKELPLMLLGPQFLWSKERVCSFGVLGALPANSPSPWLSLLFSVKLEWETRGNGENNRGFCQICVPAVRIFLPLRKYKSFLWSVSLFLFKYSPWF